MRAEFKDYYRILGVPPNATLSEIRNAFRKLARQHHPDVASDKKNAEERFKQINEAYEVLGDTEKRSRYDSLGQEWSKNKFQPQPRPSKKQPSWDSTRFEFGGTGFSSFFEQVFGNLGKFARSNDSNAERKGQDLQADLMVTLEESMHGSLRHITLRRKTGCQQCRSSGLFNRRACPACAGTGEVSFSQHYQVRIPAGILDQQRLRVPGQGQPGNGRAPAGDLYFRVRLASHPDFRVEGKNLYHELRLAPWEAALGASIPIPTLDGGLQIRIPPGTQHGQSLRIRSRGLPGPQDECGDLYIVIRIEIPTSMTSAERDLWTQLAQRSSFDPRA